MAPGLTLVIADVSSHRKPEQLSLSSVIALSLHLLFASHFLVITVSTVTIPRDHGNRVEGGLRPQRQSRGDRSWSPSPGGGWGRPAGAGVLAADRGQQHVWSNETNFATSRLVFFFFFSPFLTVDMTLVLVRNQISFKVN